jgi:hypothetical protein
VLWVSDEQLSHRRQYVVHIREVDYFVCLAWEFDFTHKEDYSVIYQSSLTTFLHGFIWILKFFSVSIFASDLRIIEGKLQWLSGLYFQNF